MYYIESKHRKTYIHKIIFIEYFDGIPHELSTDDGVLSHWYTFLEDGNVNDLKLFNSGGGEDVKEFRLGENYVNPEKWSIWVAKGYEYLLENSKEKTLKCPIMLSNGYKKSRNPFKIGQIAYDETYCKICDNHKEDYCEDHIYYDGENYVYIIDNECVN
jgi:hypothetical protein